MMVMERSGKKDNVPASDPGFLSLISFFNFRDNCEWA